MVDSSSSGPEAAGDARSASGGSAADLRQLVSCHYRDVFRYAYRLSGNAADAEDFTQQTFLIAQEKLHQLRDASKALPWLFAVLRSCFLKSLGRPTYLLVDTLEASSVDVEPTLAELVGVDADALQQALQELSDEYRLVVMMFYFEELSYKEIAVQLEIPIGTVMSRLARAKSRLREKLLADRSPPLASPPNKSSPARSVVIPDGVRKSSSLAPCRKK